MSNPTTPTNTVQTANAQIADEVAKPLDAAAEDIDSEGDESIEETGKVAKVDDSNATIKELKKKLKLKVDGQEIEEEVDFNDEEGLKKSYQKARAFDKKAQELAEFRKEMQQLVQVLKDNPTAILQELGHNVDDLAYQHLQRKISDMSKSPEQIEKEQRDGELQRLKDENEKHIKEKEHMEMEQLRNKQATSIQEEIITALGNSQTLLSTEDPEAVGDIARAMYRLMQQGVVDVRVEDVIPMVEEKYIRKLQKRLELAEPGAFEKIIGKKNLDKYRKGRVSDKKVKTQTANQVARETGHSAKPKEMSAAEKKKSYRDFFNKF